MPKKVGPLPQPFVPSVMRFCQAHTAPARHSRLGFAFDCIIPKERTAMPSPTASATCLLTACILTVLVHPASAQMEDSQTGGPPVSADAAFAHYCAPCHGDDGRGKGSKTFGLSNPPPDLTQLTVRNGGTF